MQSYLFSNKCTNKSFVVEYFPYSEHIELLNLFKLVVSPYSKVPLTFLQKNDPQKTGTIFEETKEVHEKVVLLLEEAKCVREKGITLRGRCKLKK